MGANEADSRVTCTEVKGYLDPLRKPQHSNVVAAKDKPNE